MPLTVPPRRTPSAKERGEREILALLKAPDITFPPPISAGFPAMIAEVLEDQQSGSLYCNAKLGWAGRAPSVRVSRVRARWAGAVAMPYPQMSGGPGSCCTG